MLEIEKIMYKNPKDFEKAFSYIAKGINKWEPVSNVPFRIF